MEHVFEDIEGKAKPIKPQGKALKGKGAKCLLDMGSMPMTVLYIPLESRKCHVRRALALAHHSGVGLTLMAWSARVVRDVDLLPAINQKTKCVVQMALTTCDENVLSLLEKNVTFPPAQGRAGCAAASCISPSNGTTLWICSARSPACFADGESLALLSICVRLSYVGRSIERACSLPTDKEGSRPTACFWINGCLVSCHSSDGSALGKGRLGGE